MIGQVLQKEVRLPLMTDIRLRYDNITDMCLCYDDITEMCLRYDNTSGAREARLISITEMHLCYCMLNKCSYVMIILQKFNYVMVCYINVHVMIILQKIIMLWYVT